MIQSYPWYIADWRESETRIRLSLAERGLYREMLDYCYLEGSVPTDPMQLSRITCCSVVDIKRHLPVVASLFTLESDRFVHAKVNEVRAKLDSYHKQRAHAGAASGRSRRERSLNIRSTYVEPSPTPTPDPSPPPTPEPSQPCVRAVLPSLRKPNADDLNGQTSQRFEEWFAIWAGVRGNAYRPHAFQAYVSTVLLKLETSAMDCAASYIAGPGADPSHGYRPDNFIFEMARDAFQTRWPSAGKQPPSKETAIQSAIRKAKEAKNGTR